ncbi:hypothetical protein [Flavobacterium sp. K5-23]|uniref:hypothetical protein n=1 Tax=Flavobacterium sp. K5-23 TaxID=2746225 RepID=UPI00200F270E|nr:hypothetical protein [Flavobacterium sp. K5-23]UQD57556.1 hypothetical protein FLAK523_14645 [Flavobacterium sp. K5-23]
MEKNDTIYISTEDLNKKGKVDKWNKRLDDYNNYVKEYIKHYKKSLNGNAISLTKYPYMKIKSEGLAERINKAQDKNILTESQVKRVYKIKMKLIKSVEF